MTDKAPDAYRTISEAGEETGLPAHVLRFWESRFTQIKPVKRAGGRRLYRRQDIQLLKGLKKLLYQEGYTIKGAQKYLKDHGVADVCAIGEGAMPGAPAVEQPAAIASEPQTRSAEAAEESAQARLFVPLTGAGPAPARDAAPIKAEKINAVLERLGAAKASLDAAIEAHRAAR